MDISHLGFNLLYLKKFLYFTVTLLTIMNPVAAAAITVSILGAEAEPKEVSRIALKASLTVLIASLLTLFAGDFIFKLFGINLPSLKVIGGLILILLALDMLRGRVSETQHTKEETEEAMEKEDISIVPLAIPILFGPGTLTTLVILKSRNSDPISLMLLIGAVLTSTLITYLILRNSYLLVEVLGITGVKIATRLMGLVVGAIGAEFLIDGVKKLWLS